MAKAAAPAKKPAFNLGVMGALKAAGDLGAKGVSIQRASVDDIEPDPDQPRKAHKPEDLDSLAATIKEKGVLQPIGLKPGKGKKWMIVWGEGRWRASVLAGVADIPFVEATADQMDFETQVIENQQRAALSNSDLARAVVAAHAAGRKNPEIATLYRLKDHQVTQFRAVAKFPAFLAAIVDSSDMRGLYDLFRHYQQSPSGLEEALKVFPGGVAYADAQRVLLALGGKGNNTFTGKGEAGVAAGKDEQALGGDGVDQAEPPSPRPVGELVARLRGKAEEDAKAAAMIQALKGDVAPKIYVAGKDGEIGRLVTETRAKTAGCVLVAFESFQEEVPAAGLQIVDVK